MKRSVPLRVVAFGLLVSMTSTGQSLSSVDSSATSAFKPTAFYGVLAFHGMATTGSWLALSRSWYSDYPTQAFHFTNDWNDWNHMDKLGHMWTAYSLARLSAGSWRWTGMSATKAEVVGSISALGYQSLIEVSDGFSSHWGFSWSDFAANCLGINLYLSQQLFWHQQRLQMKVMAYKPYVYGSELALRAGQLFGHGHLNRLLNDYNVQTYWLSTRVRTFVPASRLPAWLSISFGYGSRLMLGRTRNQWISPAGNEIDRSDMARYRRFFIAPDIDLTAIRTRRRWLRSVLAVLNVLKLPTPALEWSSSGKLQGHFLLLN